MKSHIWKMFNVLVVLCLYSSVSVRTAAETQYESNIKYLGADWGPNGDTIYFVKQITSKKRTTGGLADLIGGVENLGSHIWFCKMKWDGSEKQEIAELWTGQGPYIDTQNGPIWMEVNGATSNALISVEYGMATVGIWVLGLDGKNLHKPFEPIWNDKEKERDDHGSWSPDGSKIVYCKDSQRLEVFDLKTRQRTQLTDGIRDLHPVWSPKGEWIAYTHHLRYDPKYAIRHIWLIRPDGKETKPLMNEKGEEVKGWWPSWNPVGTSVSIADSTLWMAETATNKTDYINPMPILGELLPYTFMAHHWGKRGWLLTGSGAIRFIDETSRRGRLLAVGGIYQLSSKDNRWGSPPEDIPPRVEPVRKAIQRL